MVLTQDTSVPAVVGWLRAGAAAVCGVDQELPRGWLPPAGVPLVERVLCWAQRARLTGELRLLEGTPLEGVAVFQGGELQRASFCWLTGVQALAEMVAIEGADVRFAPTPTKELRGVVAPRVLVAEDDETTRRLLSRLLRREGWEVFEARDGVEALQRVAHERFDVLITDLEMPRLDGWGLLRRLREEPAWRELAVVMLAEFEACGWLELDGQARLTFCEGHLVAAETRAGAHGEACAVELVRRLLTSAPAARFHFGVVACDERAPWVFDFVRQVQAALGREERDRTHERLLTPAHWQVERSLAELHGRGATSAELGVLDGLARAPRTLEELSHATGLEAGEVTAAALELLRRGVLRSR